MEENALYIPIWLYSNAKKYILDAMIETFTFQSGYIPMQQVQENYTRGQDFTFQSGYIPIICQLLS